MCLTPDDIMNYPSCCSVMNQLCCNNEAIQEELNCSIDIISNLLGRKFCPTMDCKKFDGTGSCKLFMGCELQSLTSVTITECDKCETLDCLACNEKALPLIAGSYLEYECEGVFPCGTQNVEVCGAWGEVMPSIIKKAIIWLTLETIQPGILGLTACDGVKSVTWSDFSMTLEGTSAGESNQYTTGFDKIDQLIRPYISAESQLPMATCGKCGCKKPNCRKCNVY